MRVDDHKIAARNDILLVHCSDWPHGGSRAPPPAEEGSKRSSDDYSRPSVQVRLCFKKAKKVMRAESLARWMIATRAQSEPQRRSAALKTPTLLPAHAKSTLRAPGWPRVVSSSAKVLRKIQFRLKSRNLWRKWRFWKEGCELGIEDLHTRRWTT